MAKAKQATPVMFRAAAQGVRPEHRPFRHIRVRMSRLQKNRINYLISLALIFAGSYGVGLTVTPSLLPQHSAAASSHGVAPATAATPNVMARSIPVHIDIPAISLSADIVKLGTDSSGALAAPDDYTKTGWYIGSPTPGEEGPSIITGHVDNYLGPAVFFSLRDVQRDQEIDIKRADGSTATFIVDGVRTFAQDDFPTQQVYGNIPYAGLRLITCGGVYSPLTERYSHNIVVYASLSNDR